MHASSGVSTRASSVDEWTRALAGSNGSPGGGAGTGVMLAIAASLMSMVAGYSERSDGQAHRPADDTNVDLSELRARAQSLRKTALRLADEDSAASAAVGAAYQAEKGGGARCRRAGCLGRCRTCLQHSGA